MSWIWRIWWTLKPIQRRLLQPVEESTFAQHFTTSFFNGLGSLVVKFGLISTSNSNYFYYEQIWLSYLQNKEKPKHNTGCILSLS